jgi:hypothetical protein
MNKNFAPYLGDNFDLAGSKPVFPVVFTDPLSSRSGTLVPRDSSTTLFIKVTGVSSLFYSII